MTRFPSARHGQRFVSIDAPNADWFHSPRHGLTLAEYWALPGAAMAIRSAATAKSNTDITQGPDGLVSCTGAGARFENADEARQAEVDR